MKPCPRDAHIMASNDVEGYRYYSCSLCHGFWVPGAAVRKTTRPEALQEMRDQARTAPASALACPCGHGHLVVLKNLDCEIDLCPRCHSLWLDRDEILRISRAFRPDAALLADAATPREVSPAHTGSVLAEGLLNILTFLAR